MKVPMLDLVAEHAPYRAELVAAFEKVLDSGRFVLGPEVEAFALFFLLFLEWVFFWLVVFNTPILFGIDKFRPFYMVNPQQW